jgi:hypothetical protein
VRRGINNEKLAELLEDIGVIETKASIDNKISRGTFSAAFLLQSLEVIGCKTLTSDFESLNVVNESRPAYGKKKRSTKK